MQLVLINSKSYPLLWIKKELISYVYEDTSMDLLKVNRDQRVFSDFANLVLYF